MLCTDRLGAVRASHADQRSNEGLTGHDQRRCTPRTNAQTNIASCALIRERLPADPESTTEKQP
jgi:hypothetical protein